MQIGIGLGIPATHGNIAGFTPLELSPVLWLDASDTSTITEVSGAVSRWDDKSGNGNHPVQATAAAQPSSGTRTLNSLNVLDFDGTADYLQVLGDTLTQPYTVYAVIDTDSTTTAGYVLDGSSAGNRAGIRTLNNTTLTYINPAYSMTVTSTLDPGIVSGVWNGAASKTRWVTSTDERDGTWTTTSVDIQLITLGTFQGATGAFFDGAIAEVIVIDRLLSASEAAATEQYLSDKWGI